MPVQATYTTDPITGRTIRAEATIAVVGAAAGGTHATVDSHLLRDIWETPTHIIMSEVI